MYNLVTSDDMAPSLNLEFEDEDLAWDMFKVVARMYMESSKREGDHAEVTLWKHWDTAYREILARYTQNARPVAPVTHTGVAYS